MMIPGELIVAMNKADQEYKDEQRKLANIARQHYEAQIPAPTLSWYLLTKIEQDRYIFQTRISLQEVSS